MGGIVALLVFGADVACGAQGATPLEVAAQPVDRPSGGQICAVAIANPSTSEAISGIWITLGHDRILDFRTGPIDLAPTQTRLVEMSVRRGTSCAGEDRFFRVEFQRAGVHNETILVPSPGIGSVSAAAHGTPLGAGFSSILAAAAGASIALFGGYLTHLLARSRDNEKEIRTLRQEHYQVIEPACRHFLNRWDESLVPQQLQASFEELQNTIPIESKLVACYRKTYGFLASPSSTDKKNVAAQELVREVEIYLSQYDPKQR
jgi:hypothetical protein